jgi:hypothetical protein
LLHDVRELVRNQAHSVERVRAILAVTKDDVLTQGERACVEGDCRSGTRLARVHPNSGELMAETRLEEATNPWVE